MKRMVLSLSWIFIYAENVKNLPKGYTNTQISELKIQSLKEFSFGNYKRPDAQGSLLL